MQVMELAKEYGLHVMIDEIYLLSMFQVIVAPPFTTRTLAKLASYAGVICEGANSTTSSHLVAPLVPLLQGARRPTR